jgi:type I restriction enzyme M protein
LGNKLPIVHLGFQDLKDVIFKLNAHGEIDIDKPIRDAIGNETVESIDTIRKLLSNIDSGMMNSIIVVENMKSIIRTDSDSLQLTDTDINEFIRSDQGKRTSQFSNVKLHPTNMGNHGLRHKIDQRQFKILLDNIYSNAQLHSFVDKDIQYDFWISLFDWKKEVEIVFQTNGHPFPNDITVEKYTEFNYFSGPNGHSGIGGYLIGQVVNNHNGKISLRARNDLMQSETSITITLPK